jgi:hypothetical protein
MQRDIKPGVFETISNVFIGTFVLNEWTHFKLDGDYKFLLSDIVIKEGGTTIPGSNYEIAPDTKATTQESGLSGKTLYGQIRITNITYTGVELNVSGSNFGSYVSNESNVEYIDDQLLSKTETEGSDIDEGELAQFVGGGSNIKSDNSGAIPQWQAGTIYNTAGTLVRREGITYSASGQATNQGIDPSDPDNALYWYEPDSARDLKRAANRGTVIDGDFHTVNDRAGGNFNTSLLINKFKVGAVNKELHMVHLDGSVVTGNSNLEALLLTNPYVDLIAPDNLGTRTLIDTGDYVTTPQSVGGDADVVGVLREDQFQGHYHTVFSENSGTTSRIQAEVTAGNNTPGGDALGSATNISSDGVSGVPRIGTTTHGKRLTVGSSYIIAMIDA